MPLCVSVLHLVHSVCIIIHTRLSGCCTFPVPLCVSALHLVHSVCIITHTRLSGRYTSSCCCVHWYTVCVIIHTRLSGRYTSSCCSVYVVCICITSGTQCVYHNSQLSGQCDEHSSDKHIHGSGTHIRQQCLFTYPTVMPTTKQPHQP